MKIKATILYKKGLISELQRDAIIILSENRVPEAYIKAKLKEFIKRYKSCKLKS